MPDDNIIQFQPRPLRPDHGEKNSGQPPRHPPMLNIPPLTKSLAGSLLGIFLTIWILTQTIFPNAENIAIHFGAFIPARWTGGADFFWWTPISLISFSFLHGGWLHLGTNLLMLVAIGSGLEKSLGIRKFILVYLVCTLFGVLSHLAFTPFSTIPIVGASGGISGLFGAMLTLMHKTGANVGNNNRFMPVVMVFIAISIIAGFMGAPDGSPIAWMAHIGGFLSGIGIMMILLKQPR